MDKITFKPNAIRGTVNLPSSKSIVNRLLIMNALSGNKITINNLINSEDTLLMQSCLKDYQRTNSINAQNAGTVFRFLTAFLSIQEGQWLLNGSKRMQQRPIQPLVDGLCQLGAKISYAGKAGYPPLIISGGTLRGGLVEMDNSYGSQFISALLMIAPLLETGLELTMSGSQDSLPYIDMTIGLMNHCGIDAIRTHRKISVPQGRYQATTIEAEADWSAAAFIYEMAALSRNCEIAIPGLSLGSLQGDSILPSLFLPLGVRTHFENDTLMLRTGNITTEKVSFDFSRQPDLFIPIALTCAGLGIDFRAQGIRNLRIKESDRIQSAIKGLNACGINAITDTDRSFKIPSQPGLLRKNTTCISSCGDHRIAMAFAALAIKTGSIIIDDLDVAGKSYPGFAGQIRQMGFDVM